MAKRKKSPPVDAISRWQRFMLAFFSISLICVGCLLLSTNILGGSSKEYVGGTLFKVGFVLGLAWLAAPQLAHLGWQRVQGSLLIAVVVVVVLMAMRPRIGAIAASLLVAGSIFFAALNWVRDFTRTS